MAEHKIARNRNATGRNLVTDPAEEVCPEAHYPFEPPRHRVLPVRDGEVQGAQERRTKSPKVYLASGFRARYRFRDFANFLKPHGIEVCSSWIWVEERPDREAADWDYFAGNIAKQNYLDLLAADCLVVDTECIAYGNHGGVHFETGFMYAKGKPIILIGERGNTFHWLPEIDVVKTYTEAELLLCLKLT